MQRPNVEGILTFAEKATEEPWEHGGIRLKDGTVLEGITGFENDTERIIALEDKNDDFFSDNNMFFIANARTDVPLLCKYILELEEKLKDAKQREG